MTIKQWAAIAIGAVLALGVAFTAGRYSTPAKVIERERIVTVEKEVKVVDQQAIASAVAQAKADWKKDEKVRTITKTVYKEGQIVEKIVYKDRETQEGGSSSSSSATASSNTSTSTTTSETTTVKDKEKITVAQTDRWRLSLSAATKWDSLPTSFGDLTYEGRAELRLVGGLWAGVTTTPQLKLVGATLAFQF
jgi:DNA-binding winged helix-turn-helix (wHTH) protein